MASMVLGDASDHNCCCCCSTTNSKNEIFLLFSRLRCSWITLCKSPTSKPLLFSHQSDSMVGIVILKAVISGGVAGITAIGMRDHLLSPWFQIAITLMVERFGGDVGGILGHVQVDCISQLCMYDWQLSFFFFAELCHRASFHQPLEFVCREAMITFALQCIRWGYLCILLFSMCDFSCKSQTRFPLAWC